MDPPAISLVMAGHVDHGKSTLIGRLLYDTGSIHPQVKEEIEKTAQKLGKEMEFAFFMDSLEEEREHGITIDTVQVRFRSRKNLYNIIDVPGHKEFIKNMMTGASHADAVLLVVSAKGNEGVQEQTKRHMFLARFLGINQVIVAINKMDSVSYDENRFNDILDKIIEFLKSIGYNPEDIAVVPVSAKEGDNIAQRSYKMKWYNGPSLIGILDERIMPPERPINKPLRMVIQDVYNVNEEKIIIGRIETGVLRTGDRLVFQPLGMKTKAERIESLNKEKNEAKAGESIGLVTTHTEGIRRGQVCGTVENPPTATNRFSGKLFMLANQRIDVGERLGIRCGTAESDVQIEEITKKIDSETGEVIEKNSVKLEPNEAGIINAVTKNPIVMERFSHIPQLGRFVILKKNNVVAAGTVSDLY